MAIADLKLGSVILPRSESPKAISRLTEFEWFHKIDTDNDGFPNFNDPDDDGDGKLTRFEVESNQYNLNPGDADPELAENEVEMQRKTNLETGIVTLYTVVFTDANNDGIADYLDENTY